MIEIYSNHFSRQMTKRKSENKETCKRVKIHRSNLFDLPNELIYQIFSYLTDGEIFESFVKFDSTNRFDELIRNRTSIDFRSIRRISFKINSNSILTNSVRRICLFNDEITPSLINAFLSPFEFQLKRVFPNLVNLILDQPEQNDLIKLLNEFDQLEHLSIRLPSLVRCSSFVYSNVYSSICKCRRLKSLSIIDDPDELISLPDELHFVDLKHLTLGLLTKFDLEKVLVHCSNLKTLKCSLFVEKINNDRMKFSFETKLIQLEVDCPRAEFEFIESILKSTKKLEKLKLICRGIDANIWKTFIETNLPNLIDFQFKFDIRLKNFAIENYQTDWWTKEKHWLVVHHPLSPFVYTIPLIETKLIFNSRTAVRQQTNESFDGEYSNIRQLILTLNPLGFKFCRNDQIYFPRVDSLTLIDYKNSQKPISHLKTLINLSTIRHLTIDHRMHSTTFLLLVKEMTNLHSLAGQDSTFFSITKKFQNDKVLSYLKSNIDSLSICPLNASNDIRYVSQLCVAFEHIQHLTLTIKSADQIWPWLNKLTRLRSATIFCRFGSFTDLIDHKWFYNVNYELRSRQDLRLWIR
mgnify:FL=1